jgi:hypothetical protein
MKAVLKHALIFIIGVSSISGCYTIIAERQTIPSLKPAPKTSVEFTNANYTPADKEIQSDSLKYLFSSLWILASKDSVSEQYKRFAERCGTMLPYYNYLSFYENGEFYHNCPKNKSECVSISGYYGFNKAEANVITLVNKRTLETERYLIIELKEDFLKLSKLQ